MCSRRCNFKNNCKVVTDSGTDADIKCGTAWKAVYTWTWEETQFQGNSNGKRKKILPCISVLTVYELPVKGPILLGVKSVY